MICNQNTIKDVQKIADMLSQFLAQYSSLTKAYVLDYFVEDHWNTLPEKWQNVLSDFEIIDLQLFLNSKEKIKYRKPWPLSLLAFRACAFNLALKRTSVNSLQYVETFLNENFHSKRNVGCADLTNRSECGASSIEFDNESGQHKQLPEFCRRHVKRKKQHEIFRLAQIVDLIWSNLNIKHVIDIGSGQGHLSRFLALCYNYKVATVEAEKYHISGAKNFDTQAYNALLKSERHVDDQDIKTSRTSEILPDHSENCMTENSSKECLENIAEKFWIKDSEKCMPKFGILGLHSCGDLSATILKTYVNCCHSLALLSVGCCYMKLNSKDVGYPLSSYVKVLQNHLLSYEAREVACHAIEMFIERLKNNSPSLKIHCYRAVLEKCIVSCFPDCRHMGFRGVKHAELLEFHDYAERALQKVNIEIPKKLLLSPDIQDLLKEWKKVLTFYCLRLTVAPVIESLILIDKILYLFEHGYPSCIVPIFDPSISPRNHLIISVKSKEISCNVK